MKISMHWACDASGSFQSCSQSGYIANHGPKERNQDGLICSTCASPHAQQPALVLSTHGSQQDH